MYDFPPYRPPSEAASALVRVTHGCPWNHCTFCGMYKNTELKYRSFKDISDDISVIKSVFPGSETVFMGDSDSLLHKDILKITGEITHAFPEVKRITFYARSLTLARITPDELRALKDAGLTRVHVGLESGDRVILKKIRKGATPEIMIKGGLNAKKAGLELCYYILCGIGGESLWKQHADGSAYVVNRVNPDFIRLRTISLVRNAPLYNSWKSGEFDPQEPMTRLKETKRFIKKLEVSDCMLASDHVTNYLWSKEGIIFRGVDGVLPEDKKMMLKILDEAIKEVDGRDDVLDANSMVQQGFIKRL